jgi:hypothetical protein
MTSVDIFGAMPTLAVGMLPEKSVGTLPLPPLPTWFKSPFVVNCVYYALR